MTVKLRLLVGVPVLVLPLALVMAWQHYRPALLPLAVVYLVALVVAVLFDRAEKAGNR